MAKPENEQMTAKELTSYKGYTFPKGAWRNALFRQFQRIDEEQPLPEGEKHPEPKPILDRIAYRFLKLCISAGHDDLGFFKELADRLDGKAPQAIALTDDEGAPVRLERVVRQIIDPPSLPAPIPDHKTLQ